MKFKQWFWEDAQGATDSYGDELDPKDSGLYDPEGHERKPVPNSKKANRIFGVKPRPARKEKKKVPSFVHTSS